VEYATGLNLDLEYTFERGEDRGKAAYQDPWSSRFRSWLARGSANSCAGFGH